VNHSCVRTRPRLLLALLLAALAAGAVPLRVHAAGTDKASGACAWRAASVRPVVPRPDLDFHGFPPLGVDAGLLLPAAAVVRVDQAEARPAAPATRDPARSPLPRAPPLA
jgi:hypothetical protein